MFNRTGGSDAFKFAPSDTKFTESIRLRDKLAPPTSAPPFKKRDEKPLQAQESDEKVISIANIEPAEETKEANPAAA